MSEAMPNGNYDEKLIYDRNGNITELLRNGDIDAPNMAWEIDNLQYTYEQDSNKLLSVTDSSTDPSGFKDVVDETDDYDYDANGNLTSDLNKGVVKINYNHLNLPKTIAFSNGNQIVYHYNADGEKVFKEVTEGTVISKVDYLNGFQYLNGLLQFFPTPEGYVRNTSISGANNYNFVFQYKDHLGNIRMNYAVDPRTQELKIVEQDHYYPFGLKHANYLDGKKTFQEENLAVVLKAPGNPPPAVILPLDYNYKYNGKEWQDELELNFYDYGARNYDPAIGRWMNIDPMAEKSRRFSPYVYALNNPVYFIDPDGMQATPPDWFVNNKTGAVVHVEGQSKLTQTVATAIGAGDAKNYDRLGADNMFGEKVIVNGVNIRNEGPMSIENPEKFMDKQGYDKAENVTVQETEYKSGGRMGEENITHTVSDLKQIGQTKVTYTKDGTLNQKDILNKETSGGRLSSVSSVTYNVNKTPGTANNDNAYFYSNKTNNANNAGQAATFVDNLVKVIKAIIK
ncbi:RHS repeat-associated core domain-containing protein [Flavobacterium sp.]|uniref:RHS repeat domain-containing protein n=1 Tax=Flavobacterium sp. TaxID=239 RepID=UPI00120FFE8F|nr:RHS repeat-associated core domain-containing protein [Flavobacterium sp.]RZJ72576.1 MAG: RHS repeat-associated core domain-containing protein [Flavobacterium sp.]